MVALAALVSCLINPLYISTYATLAAFELARLFNICVLLRNNYRAVWDEIGVVSLTLLGEPLACFDGRDAQHLGAAQP